MEHNYHDLTVHVDDRPQYITVVLRCPRRQPHEAPTLRSHKSDLNRYLHGAGFAVVHIEDCPTPPGPET